ncbi:hypothetical protein NDU88_007504 [Pleurodeles waltl]|uniref:Uncharacterized protein n=1 Tax=Pleurodeles waltl TaxID=8319 RepID=A0AAV7VTR1_PLEWA|nr:hypothetical protein NDU88_007504 [Pleurodeles waltl]
MTQPHFLGFHLRNRDHVGGPPWAAHDAVDELHRWALLHGDGPFLALCFTLGVMSSSCVASVLPAAYGELKASFKVHERNTRTARACAVGPAQLD